MSSCINKNLTMATTSLNNEGYFVNESGARDRPIEEYLSPDDWRLKAIHAFRRRIKLAEIFDTLKSARSIRNYFIENGVINPYAQIYIMFSLNAKIGDIQRVTGLSTKIIGKNPISRSNRRRRSKDNDNDIRTIEVLIKDLSPERLRGLATIGEQAMLNRQKRKRTPA